MRPTSFVAALLCSFLVIGCGDAAQTDDVIYVDEPPGEKLLQTATDTRQLGLLMRHFQSEQIDSFCGVASSVMVLNALWDARRVVAPHSPGIYPCKDFDQINFFTADLQYQMLKFEPPKKLHHIMGSGMTLDELSNILKVKAVPATVATYHVDRTSLKRFRELAVAALKSNDQYVIVNFARTELDQKGGGHFSPLAAYDKQTDRFLILDVARYKYPPAWAKAGQLWNAMNTTDTSVSKQRGFVVVTAPKQTVQSVDGTRDCPDPKSTAARSEFFGK